MWNHPHPVSITCTHSTPTILLWVLGKTSLGHQALVASPNNTNPSIPHHLPSPKGVTLTMSEGFSIQGRDQSDFLNLAIQFWANFPALAVALPLLTAHFLQSSPRSKLTHQKRLNNWCNYCTISSFQHYTDDATTKIFWRLKSSFLTLCAIRTAVHLLINFPFAKKPTNKNLKGWNREKPQFPQIWQLKNYNEVFSHLFAEVQAGKTTIQTRN